MKNSSKKTAFTLAEIMIALFISAIIAMIFLKSIRTGINHYTNNLMAYAALNGLSTAAYDMAQLGCISSDTLAAAAYDKAASPTHPYCLSTPGLLPIWNHTNPPSPQSTPATIANRGFCDRFVVEEMNVTGAVDCTLAATDSTAFSSATPNFTTTNGMRFFNFGALPANETTAKTATDFYTVYIDIDGPKRSGRLTPTTGNKDVDVIKFYVSMDGNTVVPDPNSIAANDTDYLTASVRYLDGTKYVYPLTGVKYREAICAVNPAVPQAITAVSDYCSAAHGYSTYAQISACASHTCEFELDEPGLLGIRNIFNIDNSNN